MPPRVYYSIFMLLALAAFLWARQFVPRPRALSILPTWKRGVFFQWVSLALIAGLTAQWIYDGKYWCQGENASDPTESEASLGCAK